jgi:hypothetical protein
LIFDWCTISQIDFVLAFPQADVECDLVDLSLREWTAAHTVSSSSGNSMVKSKQGYLVKGLKDCWGFFQSKVDECVFYKDKTILLVYVDDAILCGPSSKYIDDIIALLKEGFDVTDEGEIDDYLGVKVT